MSSSSFWIRIFYFGEFVNDNGKWEWKKSESYGDVGVAGLSVASNMSYKELHSQIQSLCNVNSFLYDMEMRFLLPGSGQFQVPILITSNRDLQWLLGLNKQGQCSPICVTLANKDPVEHLEEFQSHDHLSYKVEVENNVTTCGMQREDDDHDFEVQENDENETYQAVNWNELEIIPETNTNIPTQNCNNDAFPSLTREFVRCNGEENRFTSEHFVSSSIGSTSQVILVDFDLQEGQVYTTKKELQSAVHNLALKYNFEFKVKKSNTTVYTIVCIDENCKWRLRATKFNQCEYFQIRKYAPEHTCSVTVTRNDHKQAMSWIIGKHVMDKFEDPKTIYQPADVNSDVHREFGIQMSYQKARRSRESTLEYLKGSHKDSYAKLPAYAYNLALSNAGIIYDIEIDDESRFKYFFLAFGPCICGFHSSMKPVVVVDDTFLNAKYKGTLIVAICQDGNRQIYPFAWGIVDSENDASWYWFFSKLKEVTGDREDLVVIYDRHTSLIKAVEEVYQKAHHGHCIYHIKGNLKTRTQKVDTISLFMKVAEAYTIEEFNNFMDQIESTDTVGSEYLTGTKYKQWARSHFKGNRYNIITSNKAESLNSLFRKEQQSPILALIERIENKL